MGGAILLATASGLGVSPDGVAYLSLADELRTEGSPYPVLAPSATHYAPLWSMIVGTLALVTGADDLLGVGRVLNAIVAATVPVLLYLAVRRSPAAPRWWALTAAALGGLSFGLFRLSVRALTEPLFVALVLATLLLVETAVHRRATRLVVSAGAVAALAVMTRYAGAVLIVPLVAAAWRCAPTGLRRVTDSLAVAAITLAPTAVWALAAPSTTTSTHLDADARAGLAELLDSITEAGYAVVTSPSAGFADLLFLLLGVAVLAAPVIAAVLLARAPSDRVGSRLARLDSSGLTPWLLFLVAYTALIAVQRWWIDREIIDRYWIPYVVVGIVVVFRAVADLGALHSSRPRAVVVGVAGSLALVNVALVFSFAATRADRGIELNEVRYQDTVLFEALAETGVEDVLTDSARLVELHLVVLGDAEVTVRDIGCRWSGGSNLLAMVETTTTPAAVVLAGACDREETLAELAAVAGDDALVDTDVGTFALIGVP